MQERNREYNELVAKQGQRGGRPRPGGGEREEEDGHYAATLPINDRASELVNRVV